MCEQEEAMLVEGLIKEALKANNLSEKYIVEKRMIFSEDGSQYKVVLEVRPPGQRVQIVVDPFDMGN